MEPDDGADTSEESAARAGAGRRTTAVADALGPDLAVWRFARSQVLAGDVDLPACVCGRPVRNAHVLRSEPDGAELFVGPICATTVAELLREGGNERTAEELEEARRRAARALKSRKDARSAGLAQRLIDDLAAAAAWLETARESVEHGPAAAPATPPAPGHPRPPRRYGVPKGWATFAARLPSPPHRPSSTALSGTRRRLARWLAEAARWSASLGITPPPVPTDERARAMLLRIAEGGVVERGERVNIRVEPSVRDELLRRAGETPTDRGPARP